MGLDVFADRADNLDRLICRVCDLPVLVALAWIDGQESPQPIVITTSAARTTMSVSGLGNSRLTSIPTSLIASVTTGKIRAPGCDPAQRTLTRSPPR